MANLALGLMSGTSADGLTVCAIQIHPFKIVRFQTYPYPKILQKRILNAYQLNAAQLSELNYELGTLYAKHVAHFLRVFHLTTDAISVIGSHGQTVVHAPNASIPHTLQIGESSFLAAKFSIPVVSDFRSKDIVLGGQGAPLIPFFDAYIWGKKTPKILLNIGGISNLSLVGKDIRTIGFDAGPGNTLIDLCAQRVLNRSLDKDGATASKGTPDKSLVDKLLKQPFFAKIPPKSLDKNDFGEKYLTRYFPKLSFKNKANLLATVTYFTAAAIADQVTRFIPRKYQKEIVVSGGGCYNQTLLRFLRELLPHIKITTSQTYGIDPQAKEAAAFALMAWLAINRKSNHCSHATGARKESILGKITL